MISIDLARGVLLVMSALALLTATVLDGFMIRRVVQPVLRLGERMTGEPARPPRPMAFMFEHAWARRLYHLVFAVLLFAAWWHLGTPSGEAHWATMMSPPR
jgi:hypothetical protein